jgi:hypothetical protein
MVPIRMGSPLAAAGGPANALNSGKQTSAAKQAARSSGIFITFTSLSFLTDCEKVLLGEAEFKLLHR